MLKASLPDSTLLPAWKVAQAETKPITTNKGHVYPFIAASLRHNYPAAKKAVGWVERCDSHQTEIMLQQLVTATVDYRTRWVSAYDDATPSAKTVLKTVRISDSLVNPSVAAPQSCMPPYFRVLPRYVDLLVHLFTEPFTVREELWPVNLLRSNHGEVCLNCRADGSVHVPELTVGITEMLLDIHDPVVQPLHRALNFFETILPVSRARERETEVEPGYVIVFIDGKRTFQLPARLRISFGDIINSPKVALNRPAGEIGAIYVIGIHLSGIFEITSGRLIIANTKSKPAGLDVATRLEGRAGRDETHNNE